MRKRRHTKKRKPVKPRKTRQKYHGGVRPDNIVLQRDNIILREFIFTFYSNVRHGIRQDLNEIGRIFTTISPYASYSFSNNLLITYLAQILLEHIDNNAAFDIDTIRNLIARTIETDDQTLLTDRTKVIVLMQLLERRLAIQNIPYLNEYVDGYNDLMFFMLTSVKPIKDQEELFRLYNYIVEYEGYNNESNILKLLVETGNVFTDLNIYNEFMTLIHEDYIDAEFFDILKKTNPATLHTLNVLYPAQERGIHLPPDVVDELHKYSS